MAIYLDTAIVAQAKKASKFGWIAGITTNPTHWAAERFISRCDAKTTGTTDSWGSLLSANGI